jgi:hypothetical protein
MPGSMPRSRAIAADLTRDPAVALPTGEPVSLPWIASIERLTWGGAIAGRGWRPARGQEGEEGKVRRKLSSPGCQRRSNLTAEPFLALSDRGQIEGREHKPCPDVGHRDDPAGGIDGKRVSVAAWYRIVRDGDANNGLEGAPTGLRDPYVAKDVIRGQIATIRHRHDLGAPLRQRARGFRIFSVHTDHQTSADQAGVDFDIACRETRAGPTCVFRALEVADMHFPVMQDRPAAAIDQQGGIQRCRFGFLQKRRNDMRQVRLRGPAEPADKIAVQALRLRTPARSCDRITGSNGA